MELPSEAEEVWRYSPIDRLALDDYSPAMDTDPIGDELAGEDIGDDLGDRLGLVVVANGRPLGPSPQLPPGVEVAPASEHPDGERLLGSVLTGGDALGQLHDAFVPDALVVDVGPGTHADKPLLIVHRCGSGAQATPGRPAAPAVFPHTVVRVAPGSQMQVVEAWVGAGDGEPALVLPVTELIAGDAASLSYVSVQLLGDEAWTLGRLSATVSRDATLKVFTAGLGAAYDRLRSDVAVTDRGASSQLYSMYLGTGTQVHDVRTLQDHRAPSTVSDLLCIGAVADSSRSIYSGLIRVRPGAVRADAMQSNHNLVLGEDAHADSVPNLDIQENDVRCSHASSVGPVGVDERFYLESRGVPSQRAERLIVLGFFDDVIERCPVPGAKDRLRREVGSRLGKALG